MADEVKDETAADGAAAAADNQEAESGAQATEKAAEDATE